MSTNEFTALRTRARERRDAELERIKAEYELSIRQIDELEHRIDGRRRPKLTIAAAVDRVIPSDGEFTLDGIMDALEVLDGGRVWPKASVQRHIRNPAGVCLQPWKGV